VSAGAVLLESAETNTFVPIAVWPEPVGDLSRLGAVAQRALSESRAIVHASGATRQLGYPIQVMERTVGAVALELTVSDEARVAAASRQLHWSIAWISDLLHRRELQAAGEKTERIGSVMEAVATALRQGKLQHTLFDLSNHVARQLGCSRVAVGLADAHRVRVAALSDAAWVEKASAVAKRYAAAMEEALDRRAIVDGAAAAHQLLAQETGAAWVLSIPLVLGATCVGVMTVERAEGEPFGSGERAWLEALAGLLAAVIDQKRRAERGYLARLRDDARALLARLFGPRHLVWKFATTLAVLLVAVLTLVEVDYRVSAKTVIEGEVQRVTAAPFEGFVAAAHVRAGDTVREGQLVAELDDRDLKIEQAKWAAEREQHDRKLREAMANRELASVQVIAAQLKQAEAQHELASERIKRARIVAPFDGVVVSGDLSQLIGSPVEQGKKLFEIAPLASYRVILQVDEREIRHVEVGQAGSLVISGIAGEPIAFHVVKVTPVATAQDGRNFFRVEARLERAPPRLRPGMEGIGKVGVGERRLWWILTHTFTDWLRLTLWSWTL
jgi:multidrug efflux pump subunit AcrA (membrane-fusion protein)